MATGALGSVSTVASLAIATAAPSGVGFTATLDRGSVLVGQDGEVRAELVITAPTEVARIERRDTDRLGADARRLGRLLTTREGAGAGEGDEEGTHHGRSRRPP